MFTNQYVTNDWFSSFTIGWIEYLTTQVNHVTKSKTDKENHTKEKIKLDESPNTKAELNRTPNITRE